MQPGAWYQGDGSCRFTVWAPRARTVAVRLVRPEEKSLPLEQADRGYWTGTFEGVAPGTRYYYRIDGTVDRPDPASFFQPEGVHGPSEVIDHARFSWTDTAWRWIELSQAVIYELHVGTFTPEGTFDAAAARLEELRDTGFNAIELMPVAQFPGTRNWGYDGAYPYAVQDSYGGPDGLKRFVDACHAAGMMVVLDVVYNHLGPEGCYLRDYAPYFSGKYRTPWGEALNFDDALNDGVRTYFIQNALCWFREYHVDALRLDAVHGIFDFSARPFLAELAAETDRLSSELKRKFVLIAESDLNDAKIVNPPAIGGYGLHAQWNDDFHHCVHTLLTGETQGYYADFGSVGQLARAIGETFVYAGNYSHYRKKRFGNPALCVPADRFVVFTQNHDQTGNRMMGERLASLVSFEARKLAAGILLLSPYIPLVFMGEEYGETAPFLYFVSHTDPDLVSAVRKGRRDEFREFSWEGEVPDPQDEATFRASVIDWSRRTGGEHKALLSLYRELIDLRRRLAPLARLSKDDLSVCAYERAKLLFMTRRVDGGEVFCAFNFGRDTVDFMPAVSPGNWVKRLDSADAAWSGPGTLTPELMTPDDMLAMRPESFILYERRGTR